VSESRPALAAPFELRARVLSSVVLIVAVIAALISWTPLFATAVSVAAILGLREWHRLVNGNLEARETLPSALALAASVLVLLQPGLPAYWSFVVLFLGAALTALSAGLRRTWVLWHGVGVLYVGIATLSLVALHAHDRGLRVGGVFVAVWAADIAALFVGRTIGGPRLAPALSPNKTWAGFVGGILAAGLAEALYFAVVAVYGGTSITADLVPYAFFGVFLGLMAAIGDLFESWVKRQFRAKNSGSLIPGHGGMLDRIDSLLFAAPAAAAFLFMTSGDG
jgi:phosphatidate cytidylyltransferase